jgi:hypothetical protein
MTDPDRTQQPVQMTAQGAVRCCFCRTDYGDYALPPDDAVPISEAHWGVRFRDNEKTPLDYRLRHSGEFSRWKWRILFNGDDVTANCLEFEHGDSGWVALYARNKEGKRFMCGLGDHALAYMEHGKVVAEKVPIRGDASV